MNPDQTTALPSSMMGVYIVCYIGYLKIYADEVSKRKQNL